MKTRKHPSNSSRLKKLQSDFDCGGCNAYFDSAYLLHDHMRDHVEGGSYFYDNSIQTAFPISTKTEAATQTCPSDLEDLAGANELAVFAPSIKHEESSDTDTNNEYDDWNAVNEVNGIKEEADKTTGRDTTQIHDAKQNHALNDQVTVRQSADSKRRMASNDRISRTRSSTLKHSKANVNSNLVVSDFSKQASHHIQDVRVSLTRIDDDIISKKNHKSTVKNENGNLTKDLGENDDGLTLGKYRKLRPTAGKEKKKLLRKSKKSIKKKIKKNLDETNVSDPDFNPGDEELPESPYPMDDDDYDNHFDISEADTDDPHWQIAKIECKNMKCEHCDKFTESMFSKLNLLALHRIPFRQENGRIFIKGKKVLRNEQTGKNYVEESEIDFVIDKEAARETFICDECGGTYKDRNNFLRHKKIHTHSLACPHCDYTPTSRKHLRTHLKTHKQKTALQCDFCGMVFNHKKGMVRHVRAVHLGQKRFICDICGKQFYDAQQVQEHRLVHFAPSYQCSYCEKKFRGLTSKRRHELIHTGVKRYVCHICNHGFIQSTPYWVHMEKRHGIPKDEVKAMRKEGVYKRKVMTANFGQELIAQSLSQEAKEAASKI